MLVVIGCGNSNRSDDGAGVVVARNLLALPLPASAPVKIFDAGTNGMDILFQARGARKLVIVDAASSGSEPGAVFEVPGHELENRPKPSYTLHDFRWDHALYAGRQIWGDGFPTDVTVFLIEAATLGFGLDLTPKVAQAVDIVTSRIAAILAAYCDAEAGHGTEAAPKENALPNPNALPIRLHRDHIYIEAAVFEAHLSRVQSVALVREAEDLLILPIASAEAGGFVVKQVNARGDRAIHAADFFRLNGIDDALDIRIDAYPRASIAGFLVEGLFANAQTKFAI